VIEFSTQHILLCAALASLDRLEDPSSLCRYFLSVAGRSVSPALHPCQSSSLVIAAPRAQDPGALTL
jgi:hypothetical protein